MFDPSDSVKFRPFRLFARVTAPRMMPGLLLGAALLAARSPASAQGTFEAIQNYSTDGTTRILDGTLGWSFQTTTPITVTALGCFTNALTAQGMAIGLWQSDGSLLASNLVTTLSGLAGLSRYESINPIFLESGQTYYMGAYSPSGTTILETYIPGTTAPLVIGPDITIGGLASGGPNFAFPAAEPGTSGDVYLGANLQYQQGVPEPSCLSLFGLAACIAAWRSRSRR